MSDNLDDTVRAALRKSGAALELRVARAFQYSGFDVAESFRYTDPIEQKLREGDLAVHRLAPNAKDPSFTVVIECKDSPESAWVAIRSSKRTQRSHWAPHDWFALYPKDARAEGVSVALGERFLTEDAPATRIVSPLAGNNPAADATRQALSACLAFTRSLPSGTHDKGNRSIPLATHAIAVVVTTATLYTCSLNAAGNDLDIQQVDRIDVLTEHGNDSLRPVLVMNERALKDFVVAFNPNVSNS